ncbi:PQQ-binding-like beta-propeller repeat protein, partial [Halolamina sp. R1-12]|uniref:outer membrane protein assembly factor BamB family protein n=1 Tax=Halolamina sp. R1-12 TaxID=2715752 RepID=UPI00141526E6
MSETSTLSRIARQLTLRRLELTALSTTALAFILTVALVGTGQVHEANPATAALADHVGWAGAGVLGIGYTAGAFALFRRTWSYRYRGVRVAHVGAVLVAAPGVADLAVNAVRLAQVGLPSVALKAIVATASPVVLATVVAVGHPVAPQVIEAVSGTSIRTAGRQALPGVVAVLVVTSTFVGGIAFLGTQPVTEEQSGTAAAAAGDKIWNTSTGDNVLSSPTLANGTVYVGSYDGSLYAFDADTGTQKWSTATGGSIYQSSPTVANGTVYLGSYDGSLYAFDADTGTQKWSAATGDSISGSPTVANGTVYVGSADNSLYAFDADTGTQKWSAATGDNIKSSPTVANGTVYVGSWDNSLYAFDADTGTQKWSTATGGNIHWTSPTVANGTVYVGSYSQSLHAFDADTGTEKWSAATGDNIKSSPTVANGVVYVGSDDNSLYAFDAGTGTQEWSFATGGRIDSSPTVANGTVYVGSWDNSLYAIDADTGSQKWSAATGGSVRSSPTVANGVVYVGSNDNSLYAFDTSHSKDSSGSRHELHTLGHVGPVEGSTSLSGLTTSATDSTSTYLTWSANQVSTTRVEYKPTSASTWSTFSTLSGSTTSETLTGLLNGEAYDVRVVADSDSTIKSTTSATTTLPADDQPVLSTPAEGQITVDRETVTTNYGEVEVQYRETNTSTWTTHTTVPYDFTTIDIENLSDEEEYTVRLQTQTEHTTGSWTDLVSTGTLT